MDTKLAGEATSSNNKASLAPSGRKSDPKVPTDLQKILSAAPSVEALWKNLTPIARRDFIFWIESAKQPETRKRRIESLGGRLKAGKRRPCCFTIVPMNLYKSLGANPKAKAQWKDLTPTERRDFVNWIDSAKQPELSKSRVGQACELLATGKQYPQS